MTETGKTGDEIRRERWERTRWFREARFGMFIHWGLYAIPARGEWVRSHEKLSEEDYRPFFEQFNPTAYDPRQWAAIAKDAGMKYAVLTAKHHDGFCLWDSALTDYKCTNTPCGRDLVAEYVEAFREAGLGVGLYYSLPDWRHPDYPAWGDRQHPMRDNPEFQGREHNWPRYVEYLHGQVRELLSKYGKIDIAWFDFSYGEYIAEKWRAAELVTMARRLQPHLLIDDRLGYCMHDETPAVFGGDFAGPEQGIPAECLRDKLGNEMPWEACITLNDHWGYCAADENYKTPADVIRTLVHCVSKNGNLLLNVGPDALGRIPEPSAAILREVGQWLRTNGRSIYGCGAADLPRPDWGRFTRKGDTLYAHVTEQVIGQIPLAGLGGKVKQARRLCDGAEVILSGLWNADVDAAGGGDLYMALGKPVQHTYRLPDPVDTVIELSR